MNTISPKDSKSTMSSENIKKNEKAEVTFLEPEIYQSSQIRKLSTNYNQGFRNKSNINLHKLDGACSARRPNPRKRQGAQSAISLHDMFKDLFQKVNDCNIEHSKLINDKKMKNVLEKKLTHQIANFPYDISDVSDFDLNSSKNESSYDSDEEAYDLKEEIILKKCK